MTFGDFDFGNGFARFGTAAVLGVTPPPPGGWILATGFWDDAAGWDDSAVWID